MINKRWELIANLLFLSPIILALAFSLIVIALHCITH